MTNKYRYFLESVFVGVSRLFFFLFCPNQDSNMKSYQAQIYQYQAQNGGGVWGWGGCCFFD